MSRIYIRFQEWECYLKGRYETKEYQKDLCKKLLSNEIEFYIAAKSMVDSWPKTAINHLSDDNTNKQPWIGKTTCFFEFDCSDQSVKDAWSELTEIQKEAANKVADKIVFEFREEWYKNEKTNLFKDKEV